MKPPSEDHDLIRWLDGEMNATEHAAFETRLKTDPALANEAQVLRALSVGIRSHLPADMTVPHADFFNSQIQVRIGQLEIDNERAQATAAPGDLLRWLRQPWLTAAGAVALAVLGLVLLRPIAETSANSFILSSYTPKIGVQAHAFHDDAADATVLMLDGLDAIPADRKVSGIHVKHSETEPQLAATTLYDVAGGRLLMISRDATGLPLIWSNSPRG